MTRPVTSSGISDVVSGVASWTIDAHGNATAENAAARALASLVTKTDVVARIAVASVELRAGHATHTQWQQEGDERHFLLDLVPSRRRLTVTGFALTATDVTAMRESSLSLYDAATALGRAPDLTRALQEAAQQARRLLRCEAIAIRIGDTPSLPLAYLAGYDDENAASRKLDSAKKRPAAVLGHGEGWFEIALPLPGESLTHGTVLARISAAGVPGEDTQAINVLVALASFLGAALDRMERGRAVENRVRVEAGGEMATAIGHSLRHALYGISSAAQLLRFRTSEDPVLEKNVGRLLREADRVARLVDTLLDFGRPVTLELENADPDESWDDVLDSHKGKLESRSLSVARKRGAAAGGRPVDTRRLSQAFAILLEGAAERAPEASDLQLVSEVIAGGAWRSRLTFAGAIEAAELQRFFDPLAGPVAGQAGVNLALSRRIVDAHGGSLRVDSDPALGTTLTVLLPP